MDGRKRKEDESCDEQLDLVRELSLRVLSNFWSFIKWWVTDTLFIRHICTFSGHIFRALDLPGFPRNSTLCKIRTVIVSRWTSVIVG